jgi:hypothetical protein
VITDFWLWSIVLVALAIVSPVAVMTPSGSSVVVALTALVSPLVPPVPTPLAAALPPLERLAQRVVAGQPRCEIVLGFSVVQAYVGSSVVGTCLEDEQVSVTTGTTTQRTTGGLLVWRSSDGALAFTDGYQTWLVGPAGLQQRLNSQRYCWEADANPARCERVPRAPAR